MAQRPRLPPEYATALRKSILDACAAASKVLRTSVSTDADKGDDGGAAAISLVLETVWDALQEYARQNNGAHSPASRLPPEILCSIFALLSFADRVQTSHVYHPWRNASLAFPARLWAMIPPTTRLDIMSSLLDRTAALAIPVDLMGVHLKDPQRVVPICELAKLHMPHIRTLRLHIDEFAPAQSRAITSLLHTPAPVLRHFALTDGQTRGTFPFESGFFCGHAPMLEQLELGASCTQHLLSFVASNAPIRSISMQGVTMRPSDPVWRFLRQVNSSTFTELEFWTLPGESRSSDKIQLPRALTRLGIHLRGAADLATLDMERITAISSVRVAPFASVNRTRLHAAEIAPFLPQNGYHLGDMTVILRRGHGRATLMDIQIVTQSLQESDSRPGRRTRTFLQVGSPTFFSLPVWDSTFGMVTSLTLYIPENLNEWPKLDAGPCSNVEHLTLTYAVWEEGHPLTELADARMAFPRLRTLALQAPICSRPPILDAYALAAVVPSLQSTAAKLEVLSLHGVSVWPSCEVLRDVAVDVRVEDEGLILFPDLWEEN
ncbi:hypothetical protein EXIGLDRAFT_727641 [Exidia glandulosa HHB12029]|uniref:F-box domain-containing protein n=1 Tax=Exidia glandulosa HHB12029 TaxID=1314781 RepID=A0A165LZU1_EXIGL|nr:hypothetical protein EXIGLDRAFT_727641 [Exidia glandulosa HHB12029]